LKTRRHRMQGRMSDAALSHSAKSILADHDRYGVGGKTLSLRGWFSERRDEGAEQGHSFWIEWVAYSSNVLQSIPAIESQRLYRGIYCFQRDSNSARSSSTDCYRAEGGSFNTIRVSAVAHELLLSIEASRGTKWGDPRRVLGRAHKTAIRLDPKDNFAGAWHSGARIRKLRQGATLYRPAATLTLGWQNANFAMSCLDWRRLRGRGPVATSIEERWR